MHGTEKTVADGIVDASRYFSRIDTPVRVLFVLKEANDPKGGGWDLREFLRNGAHWQTWNNVARWSIALGATGSACEYAEHLDESKRKEVLSHIAAINLKKVPGGSVSRAQEIQHAAEANAELIRGQVAECDPDAIVCCGAGVANSLCAALFDVDLRWKEVSGRRYGKCGKAVILDFCHPAARKSKSEMASEIAKLCQSAKSEAWS